MPAEVHGTTALGVRVDLGQGLSKTFPLAAAQPFTGARASVFAVLPLASIQAYVNMANRDLGGATSNATVTLLPQVKVSGTVGGRALAQTAYAPTLQFALNGTTLTLPSTSDAAGQGAPAADPLHPSKDASLSYDASQQNTVPLLFVHPSVSSSRIAGFGVAGLALLLCLWLARPLRAGRSPGDRDRIRALYGAQLVPVTAISPHDGPVVDVASIEALAELAKKYESMIMQVAEVDADAYLVWDNGVLYRYRSPHQPSDAQEARTEVISRIDLDSEYLALDMEQLLRGDSTAEAAS